MPPQPQQPTQPTSQKMYIDVSGRMGMGIGWYGDEGDTIMEFPEYRYLGTAGQFASGVFNPTRRYGYMCPSNAAFTTVVETDGSTNFTNVIRATVFDSNVGSAYFAENGNIIWGAGFVATSLTSWRNALGGSTISGSSVAVTDLEIYQVNGVRKIFYTYQKLGGGGGDMGIATPVADGVLSSANNTFLSTTTSGAFNLGATNDHFMVVADNNFMYIGDGNYIHKFDGTPTSGGANGTATQQVLAAPINFTFLDGTDFKGSTWFVLEDSPSFANNTLSFSGNICGVYVWDRQTTIANTDDFIPLKGVMGVRKIYVSQEGKVRILCLSSKRTTQIREFNGTVFETVQEAHLVSFPPYRDSFQIGGHLAYWFGEDGRIYAHGPVRDTDKEYLYIVGDATSVPSGSFSTGAMLFLDANFDTTTTRTALILSMKDSTPTVENRVWYPNGKGIIGGVTQTAQEGDATTLMALFPFPAKINYVRIYHHAGQAGGEGTAGFLNINGNQNMAFAQATISYNDVAKGWKYIPLGLNFKNGITSIQFSFAWITEVLLDDSTDWMPRMIEIDYEPLPKLQ